MSRKFLSNFSNLQRRNYIHGIVCPFTQFQQKRFLSLHEYQSKKLLNDFGVNVQKGKVAHSLEEAQNIAQQLKNEGADELILKCQIKAGGRGKGYLTSGLKGGVQICKTVDEISNYSKQMLNYNLITHQTTSEGWEVKQLLIHEGVKIKEEYYLAIVLDRVCNGPAFISSPMGGMDIEEVAHTNPEALLVTPIDISEGVTHTHTQQIIQHLTKDKNFTHYLKDEIAQQIVNLYDLFIKCDSTQVEINPFAIVEKGDELGVVCVDAKINFDDSAAYRQKELFAMEDKSTEDPREVAAESAGLNFVGLDGNIGCLVNGAGLAMATMDIVKLHGGSPANFLDVGGGATVDQVTEAFKILTADKNVKAMFVNIFGGIMQCDIIAEGVVFAAQKLSLSVPLVVRLCGNRVEQARDILEKSGIQCYVIDDLEEAAIKACALGN